MLDEYDFSKARKNPYAKALKKQITINIDSNTIDYFKEQSEAVGIPYQTLINLYLKDCVANKSVDVLAVIQNGLFEGTARFAAIDIFRPKAHNKNTFNRQDEGKCFILRTITAKVPIRPFCRS